MDRKIFVIICSISLWPFVFSHSTPSAENSTIALVDLMDELRLQEWNTASIHYLLMVLARGSGGRLYDLSKDVSPGCSRTIRATMLMVKQLAVCQDTYEAVRLELGAALQYVKNGSQLEEHPLEVSCRIIEKRLTGNANLNEVLEKSKEAANLHLAGPPYARKILKSTATVHYKLFDFMSIREFARLRISWSFVEQRRTFLLTRYFFECCLAMAKSKQFAESMQKLYEKVIENVVAEIGAESQEEKVYAASHLDDYWVPKMNRMLYKYIASDADLKKEFLRRAAIASENAIVDFSNLE